MHLKKLEMAGFKSFPDKIRLEFNRGITAVVGPNGSGKSNISDAIRWVLGEQSAKSLRGQKMEDVIFSGTQNRKALGYAEVSMTIDNSDKKMPMDYSEVTVTRRMYRSGDCEYSINGTRCRMKDVHELFMDTGIGREGYSIVGQGRIDEILSAKSEDRRLLFEEAAGIVKYKSRRFDAAAKLEREKQNLLRAEDLITELDQQMPPLEKQAETAKRYLDLRDQVKVVKVNLFALQAEAFEKQRGELEEQLSRLKFQLEAEEAGKEALIARLEELKKIESEVEGELKDQNEQRLKILKEIEELNVSVKVSEEQIKQNEKAITRSKRGLAKILDLIAARQASLAEEEAAGSEASSKLDEKKAEVEGLSAKLEEFNQTMTGEDQEIEEANAKLYKLSQQTIELGGKALLAEDQLERVFTEKEEIDSKIKESEKASAQRENELERLLEKQSSLSQQSEILDNEILDTKAEVERLDAQIGAYYSESSKVTSLLGEADTKRRLLQEMEDSGEGFSKSVKTILRKKKENPDMFPGVCGAVASLASTKKEYEIAIETALGAGMQNLVTLTERDAIIAIDYLKKEKLGRATFLPLTMVKPYNLRSKDAYLAQQGVLGTGLDLVTYDKAHWAALSYLLGGVLVLDTSESALAFEAKFKNQVKLVTLQGELFSAGGAITGGSTAPGSVFGRGRQLKELEAQVADLKIKLAETRQSLDSLKELKAAQASDLEKCLEKRNALQLDLRMADSSIKTCQAELQSSVKLIEGFKGALQKLDQSKDSIHQRLLSLREELSDKESESETLKKRIEEHRAAASGKRALHESLNRELADARVELGAITQTIKAKTESVDRLSKELETSKKDASELEAEIEDHQKEIEANKSNIEKRVEESAALEEKNRAMLEKARELEEKKSECRLEIQEVEDKQRRMMEQEASLGNDVARLELRIEQAVSDSERLYAEIWEEYKITPQTVSTVEDLGQSSSWLQKEERKLKSEMEQMGDVNVGAINEYKNLKLRLDFLKEQRDDILAAEAKLQDVIQELGELMQKRFLEQFEVISKNFTQVFQDMFGGGKGKLTLTEADSILEAGIEITAQPPGKNLQSMSLLSGGERALTAIALLFAILRMKPSPFCVLDEIEAALDDANVTRYARYIRKICNETQFILITHRKGTMEEADILYGVTMQEMGISKLVSAKLSEWVPSEPAYA